MAKEKKRSASDLAVNNTRKRAKAENFQGAKKINGVKTKTPPKSRLIKTQQAQQENDEATDIPNTDGEGDVESRAESRVEAADTDENDVLCSCDLVSHDEDADDNDVAPSSPVVNAVKLPAKKKGTNVKSVKKSPKKTIKSKASKTVNGRSKTSAPSKTSKQTKASGTAATKAAPKKRKGRTLKDKLMENASMAKPFFVETGSEWNATDIDFEELSTLRSMWELPAACHILWLLQNALSLRFSNTLLEYEAALLSPCTSPVLEDVFTKLLLKKSERDCLSAGIGLKYEWWNKQLRDYYMGMYEKWYALLRKAGEEIPESFSLDENDSDEEKQIDVELTDDEWLAMDILKARLEGLGMICPLKHKTFAELPAELRCKILLNLCEAVVDDPTNTEHIRMMEDDDLRVEPLGNDRVGNLFYFFPQFYEERRIYRLEPTTRKWDLWAKGDDAFRQMLAGMKEIRGRKVRGEQELIDHLEVIVEQIDEEVEQRAKQLEKANRKAILDAIPRKRSLRIQVKQLEQLEKHKEEIAHQQELSLEEIAELKRAELLRKVEKDAEREQREQAREARRLEMEQKEKEIAMAERERRRQRRMEQEKKEEKESLRVEMERKKQEEARQQRALLRQTVENQA